MMITRPPTTAASPRRRRLLSLALAGVMTATLTAGCSMQWMSMSPPLVSSDGAGAVGGRTALTSAAKAASAAPANSAGSGSPGSGSPGSGSPGSGSPSSGSPSSTSAASTSLSNPAPVNDLSTGSAHHTIQVGADTLLVDYWTTSDPAAFTASSRTVVQLRARFTGASTTAVKVTAFTASVDGSPVTHDEGSFVLTPPYSYSSAAQLPLLPQSATSATLLFTYDLLVETTPRSNQFFRQTVVDTLTVALTTKDAK